MILSEKAKRIGLFLYFDKHGMVDDYVTYMLDEMKKRIDYLLVICNGYMGHEGLKKLKDSADEVLCRANVGFDLGGYREGLFYVGWKKLEEYDELVMFNYTMMGPLYSFAEMFDTMAPKDLDFWGITKYHKVDPDPFGEIVYGFLPEHIQSHFFAIRRDMFMNYQYRDFMMNRKNPDSYTAAVCTYEAIFTKYFSDLGFKWESYIDSSDYEGNVYYPIMFKARKMVEDKKCPIIKRRSFFQNYDDFLLASEGEPTSELYDYVKKENLFDTNMIWDNILRHENHGAIHRAMHLNHISSSAQNDYSWEEKNAIFVLVENNPTSVIYRTYLKNLPTDKIDVIFIGSENDIKKIAEFVPASKKVHCVESDSSDYMMMLRTAADIAEKDNYENIGIFCLNHIAKNEETKSTVSWYKSEWNNLVLNENVIGNHLKYLKDNERLGLFVPSKPRHGHLFSHVEKEWCGRFEEAKEILSTLQPSLNISIKEGPQAPVGGNFWIKGEILKGFIKFIPENADKELAMLCISAFAQSLRHYTCVAYSDDFYESDITNQIFMFRENNKAVFERYGANMHVWLRYVLEQDALAHRKKDKE